MIYVDLCIQPLVFHTYSLFSFPLLSSQKVDLGYKRPLHPVFNHKTINNHFSILLYFILRLLEGIFAVFDSSFMLEMFPTKEFACFTSFPNIRLVFSYLLQRSAHFFQAVHCDVDKGRSPE